MSTATANLSKLARLDRQGVERLVDIGARAYRERVDKARACGEAITVNAALHWAMGAILKRTELSSRQFWRVLESLEQRLGITDEMKRLRASDHRPVYSPADESLDSGLAEE